MKELLKKLGIENEGSFEDGAYIVNLNSSDEYARVYSLLDKSDLVDLDTESVVMRDDIVEMIYFTNTYTLKLSGNLDTDNYTLTVTENN